MRPGEGGFSLLAWEGLDERERAEFLAVREYRPPRAFSGWSNGVELLGYRIWGGQGDQNLTLDTAWHVREVPPEGVDYHWTHQLFSAGGQRVWQQDAVGLAASSWRAGDLVMTTFSAPLALEARPGLYSMRVGIYTYPEIKTVPVVDQSGQPIAAYVELGPVDIR